MRTEKGYVRLKSGAHRDHYEHRVVVARLAAEFCFHPINPRTSLPDGFTVEHLDHRRAHNCYSNLILLDKRLHDALSWRSWRQQ